MIQVKSLCYRYTSKNILQDINFNVNDKEIFVIMGSSGGGKSTLLKCMSGLLTPSSGEIFHKNQNIVERKSVAKSKFAFVFQDAALFDSLTVEENILFGIRRKRSLTDSEQKSIIREQLESLSLINTEKLYPSQLSGGMRKRVGLARALAYEPEVLFYDEPTTGLDPATAYSIDKLIVETRNKLSMTSVIVSHDIVSAIRIADRIAFIEKGNIAFVGTPQEFLESTIPAVADHIKFSQIQNVTI
jgi:phospholipid/cholesterol/gamma-HCH transport system ATP-binding protein